MVFGFLNYAFFTNLKYGSNLVMNKFLERRAVELFTYNFATFSNKKIVLCLIVNITCIASVQLDSCHYENAIA